ncbi:unnamed protein product [Lactuca virosa]|uniref:Dynamin stalk domain-containing protein n=1 Tax=Lactuca virosa TaxID=75947 RepID=A0AAU9LYZ4_9ASTR|nr:unnamed protein product [Lactuca virosa]
MSNGKSFLGWNLRFYKTGKLCDAMIFNHDPPRCFDCWVMNVSCSLLVSVVCDSYQVHVVMLMKEVRDELCEMSPQSQKQEIHEVIDIDILSQVALSRKSPYVQTAHRPFLTNKDHLTNARRIREISQALVLNGFRGRLSLKIEGEDFVTLVTKSTHQDTATRMTTTVHRAYNTGRSTRLTAKKYSQVMKRETSELDGALRIEKVFDETGSREKKVNKRKVKSVERNEQLEAMDVELDMNEMDKSGQVNKTNLIGFLRDDVGQLKELEGKTLVLSTKEEPKFEEPEEKHLTWEFDKEKFEGFFHQIHGYQALLPLVSTFFCSFSSVTLFSGQPGSSLCLNRFNRNTLIGPRARKFEHSPMMSVEPKVVGEAKSAGGELDIMDRGTYICNLLLGKTIPLKLGYVGVVNRCQEDIKLNRGIHDALASEEAFFQSHPIGPNPPPPLCIYTATDTYSFVDVSQVYNRVADCCGIPKLAKKLNKVVLMASAGAKMSFTP